MGNKEDMATEAFKEEELRPGKFLHLNWDPGRENGVVAKNT